MISKNRIRRNASFGTYILLFLLMLISSAKADVTLYVSEPENNVGEDESINVVASCSYNSGSDPKPTSAKVVYGWLADNGSFTELSKHDGSTLTDSNPPGTVEIRIAV